MVSQEYYMRVLPRLSQSIGKEDQHQIGSHNMTVLWYMNIDRKVRYEENI